MVYKRFRFRIIERIAGLCLTISLIGLMIRWNYGGLWATVGTVILVYQIIHLIRLIEHSHQQLTQFLFSMEYSDFTIRFRSSHPDPEFEELNNAFNRILERYKQIRLNGEQNRKFLHFVIQHVPIGLMVIDRISGQCKLINPAAGKMLQIPPTGSLSHLPPEWADSLPHFAHHEKRIIKFCREGIYYQILTQATHFRTGEHSFILYSFQNIQSELDEKEADTWLNLIRVLTHEIMNSISPIGSLSSTLNQLLQRDQLFQLHPEAQETMHDIRSGMTTIHKRSQGLLHFIQAYRNLARIPIPDFQWVSVQSIFEHIIPLIRVQLEQVPAIQFRQEVNPDNLKLTVDSALIEQVILNLIINSIQALATSTQPEIILSSGMDGRGHAWIRVTDNGPGIPSQEISQIFTPFYTTKQTGSGIGLTWSRQIMRLHHGSIRVESHPGIITHVTLYFS
ncbi:MAG: ATP-binding protein [Candidatus Delongbacteria bacterium]|nr:ATP-binding protein [Candidatus Delongbacteria bacterium]